MAPRRYSMTGKQAAAAEFRRRILDATIKLHGQKGIFGTSWKDIASQADVSVGTVYKHFPTLNELVPACGELLMERLRPPQPDSISEIIGDAKKPAQRLLRVANALFDFYHRGGRHLESDLRERELPAMREWEEHLRSMVTGFIREALAGPDIGEELIARISFLFDFPAFNAMRMRGIAPEAAAETVTELAASWLAARQPDAFARQSRNAAGQNDLGGLSAEEEDNGEHRDPKERK